MPETKYQRLIRLLKEMFQLGDAAELDFGIYRIMHARKAEIEKFLDQELFQKHVKEALAGEAGGKRAELEAQIAELEKTLKAAGVDPKTAPKYQELVAQREAAPDQGALEDQVYSHLLTFFGRYYQEGDFISQRRYGENAYAIPYNGEEVKLYWANYDQYYIKSSEDLKHYAFLVGPENARKRVRFKLVAASTERDNAKEQKGKERYHIFARGENSIAEEKTEAGTELVIPFEYRVVTREEVAEHQPDIGARPNMRDELSALSARWILESARLPQAWKPMLEAAHSRDGEATGKSVLEHNVLRFMRKAHFDYFIHKDLGGFFRRELDWYIKHELLKLEDILDGKQTPEQLSTRHFAKLRVLRAIAEKLIDFLAQIENFQKKLWLKKKFVLETHYCVTLDRIPERLYPVVASNEGQRLEWERWFALERIEGYKGTLTPDFLKANKTLPVNTAHFPRAFRDELVAGLSGLAENTNGLLVRSDNFQALRALQPAYTDRVRCVYIDPPYNTDVSAIPYKNNYRHSSFASLIHDRMEALRPILSKQGVLFVSIDKNERLMVQAALDAAFGPENKVEELIWVQNTNDSRSPTYSVNHEFVEVYAKDRPTTEANHRTFREPKPGYAEVMELVQRLNPGFPPIAQVEQELRALYKAHVSEYRRMIEEQGLDWEEEKRNNPWNGVYQYKFAEYRTADGKLVREAEAKQLNAMIWVYRESDWTIMSAEDKQSDTINDPKSPNYRFYRPLHPITKKPVEMPSRGWKGTERIDPEHPDRNSWESLLADHLIAFGPDETKVPQQKRFLHNVETNVCKSVFADYSDGEKETTSLFGRAGVFLAPKHTNFVRRFLRQVVMPGDTVLDCFGGSGSTGHAVIRANREEGLKLKFVLVEVNEYFNTVLMPRILKGAYASAWEAGAPKERDGLSQILKVVRLESYEDACDNIFLKRGEAQQKAFDKLPEAEREKYRLHYMLNVESRGSASLLNIQKFERPFEYTLRVTRDDVTREQPVDLVETFNWLLGLRADTIRLSKDSTFKAADHGILEVTGKDPQGNRCLVLWRNVDEVPDDKLIKWFEKNRYKVKDFEWDLIYVNGDNTLENLKRDDQTWTVRLTEQEFHRLMFEGTE
ncbi:MAG: site-specific DNA-methyltransferase [Planctomycetes bacterium]|nr:site-specific DNA-methyltransferase [Planctomycetota bacterium]